jgi:hypothetical protein
MLMKIENIQVSIAIPRVSINRPPNWQDLKTTRRKLFNPKTKGKRLACWNIQEKRKSKFAFGGKKWSRMWVGRANPIIQGSFLGCSKNVFLCHSKDIKKSHKNIISSKIENGNLEVKYCGEGLFSNRIDNRSLRNYFL